MKSMLARKCLNGAPFQGLAAILPGTPVGSKWTEREQRQVRNAGGQGVGYNAQHPADDFVSQFSTAPYAPWLYNCDIFTPFPVKR